MLLRRDGQVRFIRKEGHHRLSALAHLGHKSVRVLLSRATVGVVREQDVNSWYYVKRGLCRAEDALEIFHAFFHLNGRERIQFLNLSATY